MAPPIPVHVHSGIDTESDDDSVSLHIRYVTRDGVWVVEGDGFSLTSSSDGNNNHLDLAIRSDEVPSESALEAATLETEALEAAVFEAAALEAEALEAPALEAADDAYYATLAEESEVASLRSVESEPTLFSLWNSHRRLPGRHPIPPRDIRRDAIVFNLTFWDPEGGPDYDGGPPRCGGYD
jgi:hypothetical protein